MSFIQRLKRNLSFKFLAEGISRIFSLLFFIIISRSLGDDGYGQYAFALAYATLFTTMFLDAGVNTWLIRELAQRPAQAGQIFPNLWSLRILASGGILLLVPVSLWGFNYPIATIIQVCLGSLIMIAMGWIDTLSACFNGLEQIQWELRMKSLQRLLSTGATLGILWVFPQVEAVLWVVALSYLIAVGYGLFHLTQLTGSLHVSSLSWAFQGTILKQSLPFFMTGVFFLIYTRVDVVMLSFYGRSDAEIGWYQAAVKIIDVINLFPLLMVLALYPILADYALKTPEKLQALGIRGLKLMFQMALPLSLGGSLLAPWMLPTVLGQAFIPAIPAFQILLWTLLFNFQNYLLFYTMAALNRQKLTAISTGLGLLLNIGLNLWFLPWWGYLGAAGSTLATEIVVWGLNLYFFHLLLRLELPKGLLRSILALLLMGVMVVGGMAWSWPWLLLIVLGAGVYALGLWALGGLEQQDKLLLREALQAKTNRKVTDL